MSRMNLCIFSIVVSASTASLGWCDNSPLIEALQTQSGARLRSRLSKPSASAVALILDGVENNVSEVGDATTQEEALNDALTRDELELIAGVTV